MIIDNYKIIEAIEKGINDYNQQFYREEDKYKGIDWNQIEYLEDGLAIDIPEEILAKIQHLGIAVASDEMSEERLKSTINTLSELLKTMNLISFRFTIAARGLNYRKVDMSFLENLNSDISGIFLTGIDLSEYDSSLFEKFKDLNNLNLNKCNITDPEIISKVNPKTFINIERNKIAPEHFAEAIKLIENSNGRLTFQDDDLETIRQIFSLKIVNLSDYIRFREQVDFDRIPKLQVKVDDGFDIENADCEQIINLLNSKKNILLNISPDNLMKMDNNKLIKVPTRAIIKDAGELSVEQLLDYPCITSIKEEGMDLEAKQKEPYSIEEYIKVRKEIDSVISKIKMPSDDDPDREKKIFVQIYKILGKKIKYDHKAASQLGKNDRRLDVTSSNMIGGLLEGKSVCAGYAEILRNVLSCVGIYSEYVRGFEDIDKIGAIDLDGRWSCLESSKIRW